MTQKLVMIQANYYCELVKFIKDEMKNLESTFDIQQIDYFGMEGDDVGVCTAIILFKSKGKD